MKITQSYGPLAPTSVVTASVAGDTISMFCPGGKVASVAIANVITVDTNAAGTFAAASLSANHVTITAHGYKTGLLGQLTSAGSLPTGLSLSTNYFIIVVDANTVKFASSYANAIAGTAIAISGGSGNSTFTATALAGGTVQAQWSLDATTWYNIGSPTTVTAALNFGVTQDRPSFNYMRLIFSVTAGSLSTVTNVQIDKDT